jgi:ubiquinone/menaquinone biosynthesis C-methylase UbiE
MAAVTEPNQWQTSETAAAFDDSGGSHLPTRAEQQDLLLALLAGIDDGAILDLGVGSGLVAEAVLDELPHVDLVGVDFSPPMLVLARERLRRFGTRVHLCEGDLSALDDIELPPRRYAAVISVQTIHHLDDGARRRRSRGWPGLSSRQGWSSLSTA